MSFWDWGGWEFLDSATVVIYDEPSYAFFEAKRVAGYLAKRVGVRRVILKECLFRPRTADSLDRLARSLVRSRVVDPFSCKMNEPTRVEIQQEAVQLASGQSTPGLVYNGVAVQRLMFECLEEALRRRDHVHIAFTARLLATYDPIDSRYHLRTVVCGYPSVISLSGLVHAPARAPAAHLAQRLCMQAEPVPWELGPDDDHLVYGDPRTTEVAIGYAMQALSYAVLGDPFCSNRECRLFNAHTQVEMLKAQFAPLEYCDRHMPFFAGHRKPRQEAD